MFTDLQGGRDRGLEIPQVVHRIENPEHIHTVVRRAFDEALDDIVPVVAVAKDVLCAKQHLHRRIGHGLLQGPQTFPGILAEETDAGIESRAPPGLQRPESDLIQLFCDRQHVVETQPCREQGLMCVAQDDIGDGEFIHGHGTSESRLK